MPLIDPQPDVIIGMTPAQALEILSKPLVFGDANQIKAMSIMQEVRKAEQALLKCEHDYGERKTFCSCVSSFQPGIVAAALCQLRDRSVGRYEQNSREEVERCT